MSALSRLRTPGSGGIHHGQYQATKSLLEQGLVTLPAECLCDECWTVVTVTTVTHISHFFSGAIAKTELGAGPGQVLEEEGVVINIEDGHQKRALSNL